MTEAEWLTGIDPEPMERFVLSAANSRRLRLYAVACCRRVWHLMVSGNDRHAVEVAERLADGLAANSERRAAVKLASSGAQSDCCFAAACALAVDAAAAAVSAADHAALAVVREQSPFAYEMGVESAAGKQAQEGEHVAQTELLRDIFGNPFRPASFSPAWGTPTAVALARGMYESRDFSAMPILADAIQDAGCDNAEVLNHCRDAHATHVRGCWIVDLLLGKA